MFGSLLVITEVTLFFDESKNEFAIGLTLTIMLVMYTMYQSINDSLTRTAYLKMIDFWLIFCLLVPFVTFMIEIHWFLSGPEVVNHHAEQSRRKLTVFGRKNYCRKLTRIIVLALTVAYVVCYILIAVAISCK